MQKAWAILRQYAKSKPDFREMKRELAYSLEKTGLLLARSRKTAMEALLACQESLSIRQKLLDAQPALPVLQYELAISLSELHTVQRCEGRQAEAAASFRRDETLLKQLPALTPRNYYYPGTKDPHTNPTPKRGGTRPLRDAPSLRRWASNAWKPDA